MGSLEQPLPEPPFPHPLVPLETTTQEARLYFSTVMKLIFKQWKTTGKERPWCHRLPLSLCLSLSPLSVLREKVPNGPFTKEDWLGEVELQMGDPQILSKNKQINK